MLEYVADRFESAAWRVFNHRSPVTGSSPKSLEIIFHSWLFPILEYGSPVWIFQIKSCFHYSYPVLSCYADVFSRLTVLFHRLAKAILGVDKTTTNVATLVRLGWMPLDYWLAYRACIWYMKIRLGLAGVALKNQYAAFSCRSNDDVWSRTCFYKPAHDLIVRLDPTLLDCIDLPTFRTRLRDCIFDELTVFWQGCPHARICHVIHPSWSRVRWSRLIFSRRTCSLYHQIAVGRGKLGNRRIYSKFKRKGRAFCRHGCNCIETAEHVFLGCPFYKDDIRDLHTICKRRGINYDLKNLFTRSCLQSRVEMFLGKLIG